MTFPLLVRRASVGLLTHFIWTPVCIKRLRHFIKNLRFFVNLCPFDDGLSYKVKKRPKHPQCPSRYCSHS